MASTRIVEDPTIVAERVVYATTTFDPSTRLPLAIMNSTAFPKSPDEYTPELMARIIERLPTTPYVLVFFACGAPNKPSWSWISKIYATLDRQVKKRVDKVYIVHESWWVRAITEMFRGVVSNKFKKKLIHVSSLTQLAKHVDITEINIPPAVYIYNLKTESTITIPRHHSPIFGVPLHRDGSTVIYPKMWQDCCEFLKVNGVNTRNIFQQEDDGITNILKDAYDRGQVIDLANYGPHQTASLMKLYLEELPNPILPIRYLPLPVQDTVEYSIQVFESLPYVTQKFLTDLLPLFIAILENSARTGHNAQTIAMCIAPSFIGQYSTRKDSLAVAVRYTKNLVEFWPQIDDRLTEYSESDSSACESEVRVPRRKISRMKSFDENRAAIRMANRHNIRAVNSHQDVSNSIDSFPGVVMTKSAVRSVSSAAPRSTPKRESFIVTDSQASDQSPFASSASSIESLSIPHLKPPRSTDTPLTETEVYLTSPFLTPAPPPPPPKLRKSVSTILRPSNPTAAVLPPSPDGRPKLQPRKSFSADLSENTKDPIGGIERAPIKCSTKRGRMVAELAKLYEEKNYLVEMDRSKTNIQIS